MDHRDETQQREGPIYLTEVQLAEMIGRSVSSLRRDRANKTGIPFTRFGKLIRYELKDVLHHAESNKSTRS